MVKTLFLLLALLAPQPVAHYSRVKYMTGFIGYTEVDGKPTSVDSDGTVYLPESLSEYWNCYIGDIHETSNSVFRNIICNPLGTSASVVSTVNCPSDHEGRDEATFGLIGDKNSSNEKVLVYLSCTTIRIPSLSK